MSVIWRLIKPRLAAAKNSWRKVSAGKRILKASFFGAVGLVFWVGVFVVFYRVLSYFQRVEGFGDILAFKLLAMIMATFFAVLVVSGIIDLVAKFYLSQDLPLLHSLPVAPERILAAKYLESIFDSSWMVIVFSIPIFLSYGWIYEAGPAYYFACVAAVLGLAVIAVALGAILLLPLALILPARRLRSIFFTLGILFFVLVVLIVRGLRPEQLVNPEAFLSLAEYLGSLEAPGIPYLPSTWSFDLLREALTTGRIMTLDLGLLFSAAGCLTFFVWTLGTYLYFPGYNRSQSQSSGWDKKSFRDGDDAWRLLIYPRGISGALIFKEIKIFWRDQSKWPQIFLILALIILYVYNFSVLPLGDLPLRASYLANLISYLNIGLAALVLAALVARFVYPAVAAEGKAFWLIQGAPITLRRFLWAKFRFYALMFTILAQILIVLTNVVLDVTPFIMILSSMIMLLLAPGIVSLGLGLGAANPDFNAENHQQAATSTGGLIFMILAASLVATVISLTAGFAHRVFIADIGGRILTGADWFWISLPLPLAVSLCLAAIWLPLAYGERKLAAKMETG